MEYATTHTNAWQEEMFKIISRPVDMALRACVSLKKIAEETGFTHLFWKGMRHWRC